MLCHYSYLNNDIFNFKLNCAKILLIRQKFVSLQSCYYRYVMDNRLKRQAALYMLISLVDENNGNIDINSDAIRRSFNDEDQTVMVEKSDGTIALAADMDGKNILNLLRIAKS